MNDPNRQQKEDGGSSFDVLEDVADIGGDIATDGIVDMALDGLSAAAEIAGDVVGGVLSSID